MNETNECSAEAILWQQVLNTLIDSDVLYLVYIY